MDYIKRGHWHASRARLHEQRGEDGSHHRYMAQLALENPEAYDSEASRQAGILVSLTPFALLAALSLAHMEGLIGDRAFLTALLLLLCAGCTYLAIRSRRRYMAKQEARQAKQEAHQSAIEERTARILQSPVRLALVRARIVASFAFGALFMTTAIFVLLTAGQHDDYYTVFFTALLSFPFFLSAVRLRRRFFPRVAAEQLAV